VSGAGRWSAVCCKVVASPPEGARHDGWASQIRPSRRCPYVNLSTFAADRQSLLAQFAAIGSPPFLEGGRRQNALRFLICSIDEFQSRVLPRPYSFAQCDGTVLCCNAVIRYLAATTVATRQI
jgi:hypothetical protein